MTSKKHNWYKTWFDTSYYHALYCNRDGKEAEDFINSLVGFLKPASGARFWDLACGKGRHAISLSKMGYEVVGTDLSEQNIRYALQFANDHLEFYKLDMRAPFRINYFNYVLNLFTSFGYFEKKSEDIKVFKSVYNSLVPGGLFVFDYINGEKAKSNLISEQNKKVGDLEFTIRKLMVDDRIVKKIHVNDKNEQFDFEESVKIYSVEELEACGREAGLKCCNIFGSYSLEAFDRVNSDRIIIVFQKV